MTLLTRLDIQEAIGIGKTQFYEYRKVLGIQPVLRSGRSGYTEQHLALFRQRKAQLHTEHDSPEVVIDSLYPLTECSPESSAELTTEPEPNELAIALQQLVEEMTNIPTPNLKDLDMNNPQDIQLLINIAKRRKARQILLPELIVAHLVEQLTEADLGEELQQEIRVTQMAVKTYLQNPAAIASKILSEYRQQQNLTPVTSQ